MQDQATKTGVETSIDDIQLPELDFESLLADTVDIVSKEEVPLEDRARAFWSWFIQQEERIFSIVLDENNIVIEQFMDTIVEMDEAIHLVDKDIGIEIDDHNCPEGKRKLVLTANGISRAFPAVEMLFETAPFLSRWQLGKYRPREAAHKSVQIRGCSLYAEDIRFSIGKHTNTSEFSVYMFIPGYEETPDNTWEYIGFIIMDNILGELDVAMKIKSIFFLSPEAHPTFERLKIQDFVREFDALFLKSRH